MRGIWESAVVVLWMILEKVRVVEICVSIEERSPVMGLDGKVREDSSSKVELTRRSSKSNLEYQQWQIIAMISKDINESL